MPNYPDYTVDLITDTSDPPLRRNLTDVLTRTGLATFVAHPDTPKKLWGRQIALPLPRLPEPVISIFTGMERASDAELEARFGQRIRQELADYGYSDEEEFGNPIRLQERLLHLCQQLDHWASQLSDHGLEYLDIRELLETPWDEAVQAAIVNVISRTSLPGR